MIDAREFAKALFLLGEEEGNSDAILDDLKLTDAVFSENPDYVKLLDTPAIEKSEKLALIDGALSAINLNLKNLIKILCERHSVYELSKVYTAFSALYDESRGIERVAALTAVPMSDSQISALTEKLERLTARKVIVNNQIDPSILGGIKLRYSGVQLDGSVKSRLDSFEEKLKSLVI